jgi:hypothetical protein
LYNRPLEQLLKLPADAHPLSAAVRIRDIKHEFSSADSV